MKKQLLFCLFSLSFAGAVMGQKYFTRDGKVSFFSATPVENIEAHNTKGTCVLDATSGNMEFAVLIKAFQFEKALMQEHFNENYLESDKYPKASFKGQVTNISEVNFKKDGEYTAKLKGKLTIHGVTKEIVTNGKITVKGGKVSAESTMEVVPGDYNIDIPSVVREKIAKSIKVTINVNLEELKS